MRVRVSPRPLQTSRTARALAAALALALTTTACSGGDGAGRDRAELVRGRSGGATGPAPAPTSTAPSSSTFTVATTPAGLAAQIGGIEIAIRDPATPSADLPRLGQAQQLIYGKLAAEPDLQAEVVAAVQPRSQAAVEANLLAVTELRRQAQADADTYGSTSGELPDWTIVAPEPAAGLMAEYRAAEAATGTPWQYLAAIHFVETRVGRIRGNSVAGAQGPMQFIPSTWAIYGGGGDIRSTHDAILAAGRLLRASGAPSDMASALYAYNPSNRYVRAVTAYAETIAANERAFLGYHQWQVYYGSRLLPEGFTR